MKIKPYETKYVFDIQSDDDYEKVDITKEGGDRGYIKMEVYPDRWRSPQDTADLLRKVAKLIEENFI